MLKAVAPGCVRCLLASGRRWQE